MITENEEGKNDKKKKKRMKATERIMMQNVN